MTKLINYISDSFGFIAYDISYQYRQFFAILSELIYNLFLSCSLLYFIDNQYIILIFSVLRNFYYNALRVDLN